MFYDSVPVPPWSSCFKALEKQFWNINTVYTTIFDIYFEKYLEKKSCMQLSITFSSTFTKKKDFLYQNFKFL